MGFASKAIASLNKAVKDQKTNTANFANAYSAPTSPIVGPGSTPATVYGGVSPGLAGLKADIASGKDVGINDFVKGMPDYQSIVNPNGTLKDAFKIDPTKSAAYQKMSGMAMNAGPTDYYTAQMKQIDDNLNVSRNAFDRDAGNNYATNVSNLSQMGGVDAGNLERMSRDNLLARGQGNANLYAGAGTAMAGAGAQDAMYKQNLLGNVAGIDLNAQSVNTGHGIQDVSGNNMYSLDQWGTLGDIYGSGKIADAMEPGKAANKWYEPNNFFSNVKDGSWRPLGVGGSGALGSGDKLGQAIDKYNPMTRW